MAVAVLAVIPGMLRAQMTVSEYEPKSSLKIPAHLPARAKFPFIDVHSPHASISRDGLKALIASMDRTRCA